MGHDKRKSVFEHAQLHRFRCIPRMRKVSFGHCSPLIHSIVLADSEHPDQTARMYMPGDTFYYGVANILFEKVLRPSQPMRVIGHGQLISTKVMWPRWDSN